MAALFPQRTGTTLVSRLPAVIMLLATCSGCVASRGWVYSPSPAVDHQPLSPHTVAVLPMTDDRPAGNNNKVWLYWVPLVPFGWQDFQHPEGRPTHINSTTWQFSPSADLRTALATELGNRRIFKEVTLAEEAGQADLLLQGRVSSTRYESRLYSYGVTLIAPALWVAGLPVSSVRNTLALDLRLEDRLSGRVLWEHAYSIEHEESPGTLYTLAEDFNYDDMLKELMEQILQDLEGALTTRPGLVPHP